MDSSWATLTIIAVVCLATYIVGLSAIRQRKNERPSGAASGALGVMDEIFHPNAYEASIIMESQNEAGAPAPSPEDKPFNGKITITI